MTIDCTRFTDFALDLPDEPGVLARLGARLRAADVNLIGLWGAGCIERDEGTARIHCVPESDDQFRAFLESTALDAIEGTTFFLSGDDRPGALVDLLERLGTAGVNLRAIQCIVRDGVFGAFVWAPPQDWEAVRKMVEESGAATER